MNLPKRPSWFPILIALLQAATLGAAPAARSAPLPSEFQDLATKAIESASQPKHYAAIYNIGEYALAARIHLIRSARSSIDIQTFIWADDATTRFLFAELEAAARRGVRVRLLIDHLTPFGKDVKPLASMVAAHENIEIRYFKPISKKAINSFGKMAGIAVTQLSKINRRMHNKLFVIDGRVSILGGRNYQSVYYDWDSKFNFKDRDILLCGEVSQTIRNSFDLYWDDKHAISATQLRDIKAQLDSWQASGFDHRPLRSFGKKQFAEISDLANSYSLTSRIPDGEMHEVGDVEYISDPPSFVSKPKTNSDPGHWEALARLLRNSKESIYIQSPYLVASKRTQKLLKEVLAENPDLDIHFSTNSLASADRVLVSAVALKQQKLQVTQLKYNIYQFKPVPADINNMMPRYGELNAAANSPKRGKSFPRYSIHAKSLVIDGEVAVVSSSNFDPRSDYLNTECAVVIHDKAFARSLENEIRRDMSPDNSWVVAKRKRWPVIGRINGLIASVSSRLPVLDIWPSRHTSCFELREDKAPVSPEHPDFYENYRHVGNFPDCPDPTLTLQARIIKATLGWAATPLM